VTAPYQVAQVARLRPSRSKTSTFAISASPAQASPEPAWPEIFTLAPYPGLLSRDFTFKLSLVGVLHSHSLARLSGRFRIRYPGHHEIAIKFFVSTLISVSHLQEAATIHPGTSARAGNP